MKKLILVISLIGFTFFGCSDSNIVEPNSTDNTSIQANTVNFIELPQISELRLMKEVSTSKLITSKDGGNLKIDYKIDKAPFGDFQMKSELKVPKNAFSENELLFNMILDDQTTSVSFFPSPKKFSVPLELDLEYKGFDASKINIQTLSFIYLGSDGSVEKIQFDEIEFVKGDLTVKINKNGIMEIKGIDNYDTKMESKLKIKNARIIHFSRFGFVQ